MISAEHMARLYSPESEQAVIGGLLIDPNAVDRLGALRPEHCYDDAHRTILAEILMMVSDGRPVDAVTVAEALEARGVSEKTGGLAYLGELIQTTPSARNIGHYARTVAAKALERQLLGASETIREIVTTGSGTTTDKLMAAQHAVMAISEASASRAPRLMCDVLTPIVETLERRASGEKGGLPTGFADIDCKLSGGMKPGNLVIIAGRPGMGKTSLAVQAAFNAAISGAPALVLSMEMSDAELADRLIALAGNVQLSSVLAGDMEGDSGDRILCGVGRLRDLPLIIDDQGGLSLFDVATKARSVKRKHGLSLLVVDYLQLMVGDGDNRNQQIEQISRGLKGLAKELQIPVIALSQLSRKCEERTNKRPMPSDLRESGALEQDADVILMVYRDEQYNEDSPDKGTAEVIVAKNRQGNTGMVRLMFRGETTSFADLAHGWQPAARPEEYRTKRRGRPNEF